MFKVGNKVRIINDTCFHGEELNTIIELESVRSIDSRQRRSFKYIGGLYGENGLGRYIVDEDIERVAPNPIEALFNDFK